MVLRFSRLYPLHLATLLLVALGQVLVSHFFGSWFIYGNNDITHFIGQLFFASAWFENSFNGPTWSVSVEIFLYILFFLVCRLNCIQWWQLLIYIGLGEFWLIHHGNNRGAARGVLSFFEGGLSFQIFLFIWRSTLNNSAFKALGIITLLLWFLVPLEVENHYLYSTYQSFLDKKRWQPFSFLKESDFLVLPRLLRITAFPRNDCYPGALGIPARHIRPARRDSG